jgi:hypothetical protein
LRLRPGVSPLPDEEGEQKGGIPSLFLSLSFFWFFFTPLLVLGCILLVVLLLLPCTDPHFIALYGLYPFIYLYFSKKTRFIQIIQKWSSCLFFACSIGQRAFHEKFKSNYSPAQPKRTGGTLFSCLLLGGKENKREKNGEVGGMLRNITKMLTRQK